MLNNIQVSGAKIIIAIDGYSGCGKSTTAREVATRLGYAYVDTGAMYRAVTLYFIQKKVDLFNVDAINTALDQIVLSFTHNYITGRNEIVLNGINVEDEIRKLYIANYVSKVSALPEVRHVVTKQQFKMGEMRGIVMDGRDIGTQVFPDAELKIFMTADPLVRAQRRQLELLAMGQRVVLDEILNNIKKRDCDDTTRVMSPLCQADDAILLDTSYTTMDEQIERILQLVNERIGNLNSNFVSLTHIIQF